MLMKNKEAVITEKALIEAICSKYGFICYEVAGGYIVKSKVDTWFIQSDNGKYYLRHENKGSRRDKFHKQGVYRNIAHMFAYINNHDWYKLKKYDKIYKMGVR